MRDRLFQLMWVTPPVGTPWSGPLPEWEHPVVRRADGRSVAIDAPLFWYDPPWHRLPLDRAGTLAASVAQLGILVTALRSDLSPANGYSPLHDVATGDAGATSSANRSSHLPRIVPYRPERYGLCDRDFDGARIIDVRLTMQRDETGRFAYSAARLERWESTPSGQPVSGGSWVPSASFPPDVPSIDHLGIKLDQLRLLSPQAAIFVSIGPWRLEQELPRILTSQPDGIILRLDELSGDGLEVAVMVHRARQIAAQYGSPDLPIWVVAEGITTDDAAKLVVLGASAVAIDCWCAGLWERASSQDRSVAARLGYTPSPSASASYLAQMIGEELTPRVARFRGLLNSVLAVPTPQRLASFHRTWCEQLGLHPGIVPCVDP
jgi:hypothetical protein